MRILEPQYFQCEPAYLVSDKASAYPWLRQMMYACAGAVPLISADKSLIYPLAVGAGTLRVITFYQEGRYEHMAAALVSLALTIFVHPVGIALTTAQDIALGCQELTRAQGKEAQILCVAKIFKNTLYLGLFFHQGVGLAVASLSIQIGLHVYTACQQKEWQGSIAYLGLAVVSLAVCKNILEQKWEMEQVYRIQPFPYPIKP